MTTHQTQPRTSKTCGHYCLAMLADVPVEKVVAIIGHRRGTTKNEILKAAARLGLRPVSMRWQLPSEHDTLPTKAIVGTRRKHRKSGHWCCFVDGVYHDPAEREAGKIGQNDEIVCWMEFK